MASGSGKGNSGCLALILALSFLGGNIVLLSGDLGNDLAGNPFAIIMAIIAIIADIAIIYWIIKFIVKRFEQTRQQKLQAKSDAIKAEINRIINLYRFPEVLIMAYSSQKDELRVKEYDEAIIHRVNQYQEETRDLCNNLIELRTQNDAILACLDCCSDKQKISFLQKELTHLEELKEKINALIDDYAKHQIILPDADDAGLIKLENALKKIRSSKKVVKDGNVSLIELFDNSKIPKELSLFKYTVSYIGMTFSPYTFCLFPETILVFKEGFFLSAICPNELEITVTQVETSATFSGGKYSSGIVDVDSKRIQVGTTIKTWTHVCKDGTPDLRYSYNPSIEYRDDRMKYGKVTFEIAGFCATFRFSSYDAYEALLVAAQPYCFSDESDLHYQQVVLPEQADHHKHKVIESVGKSQFPIVQQKKYFESEDIKKNISIFDALFSKCLTLEDIIKEYITSVDPQELMQSTKIEILRFYLQYYSKFKSFNWTKKYVQDLISEQVNIRNNEFQINLDKPTYEKQYASQMSVLISVLKAMLSSKINDHEHTDTFETFQIAEDEDVVVSEYAPQKINYQLFAIKKPIGEEPYRHFEKMRAVKAPQDTELSVNGMTIAVSGMGNASQFATQARYMETFEDIYESHADFQCYYPTYMNMNDEQLRTYFTWRTKVRDGQVEATDLSYVFVYIYELLNLIGVASAEEGMRQLLTFWSSYRSYDDKIDQYVERWVKEFYVYYRLSCSYKNILEKFPDGTLKESSVQEEVSQHNYQNKDAYLNQLSSHKYLQSKFYESVLGYTLVECIPLVLARVDSDLGEKSISLPTLLLGNITTTNWWHPFDGAVVDVKNPSDSYSVKISEFEEYTFANGNWRSKQLLRNYNSNLLGYIIKTTEAELRELTGYKRKLQPNISSINYDAIQKKALKVINHPNFTDVIRSVVRAYFANSGIRPQVFKIVAKDAEISLKPVEVTVNLSKLEAIRSAAAEIQDRLVIDENEDNQIQDETEKAMEDGQSVGILDEVQESTLSKPQRACLSIIISGQNVNSRITELSMANGILPEVLIEGINDLLFEAIGDNVIDAASNIPYIYDDYLDAVKKLTEED